MRATPSGLGPLIYLLLLLGSLPAWGQDVPPIQEKQGTDIYIRTNLLRNIDLVNPGLNLSLGVKRSRLAVEASYAHLYTPYTANHELRLDHGQMITLGAFLEVRRSRERRFMEVGLRVDRLHNRYTTVQTFIDQESLDTSQFSIEEEYLDSLTISKRTYTFNALVRHTFRYHRVFINIHYGLGLRLRQVEQQGRLNPQDYYAGNHPTVWQYADDPQPKVTFALPASVSIGYVF